jgi:hypothetical protein
MLFIALRPHSLHPKSQPQRDTKAYACCRKKLLFHLFLLLVLVVNHIVTPFDFTSAFSYASFRTANSLCEKRGPITCTTLSTYHRDVYP